MRQIKVLQVITSLGPGGAERLLLDMVHRFDKSKFDVRLATINDDDMRALEVYGYPKQPVELFDLKTRNLPTSLWKMRAFNQTFKPDVIHAHMFHSLIAAISASRFVAQRPRICFTSHQSNYSPLRALVVTALKPWRDADIVFRTDQHPFMNVAETKVIPNGVPVTVQPESRAKWEPDGFVRLLSVANFSKQKDPLGLVRSIAKVNLPRLTLDFVGAGPLEGPVRALATELGVAERVRFLGIRRDVRELMREAHIFVMHSKYEGMPMALLEAGAEAMPVLSTPVGSVPDVLGHDRGWLAAPMEFPQAIRRIVEDPESALATGRRLHACVMERFSIQATTRAHEELYETLANRGFRGAGKLL